MWIPGFAFCKGCCPETPCPTCLAGGSTKSCLLVTIAGVTGTSDAPGDGCEFDCGSIFNGEWLLCFAGDPNGEQRFPCEWSAEYALCAEGCAGRQVRGTFAIRTISGVLHAEAIFRDGSTTEKLVFRHAFDGPPNCYFDELELTYEPTESDPTDCDFSGATCTVSFELSHRCTFTHGSQGGNDCDFTRCGREHVPWHGVRVEIEGVADEGNCDYCDGLNGTYIFSGPPIEQRVVQSGTSTMLRGWEQILPAPVVCPFSVTNEPGFDRLRVSVGGGFGDGAFSHGLHIYLNDANADNTASWGVTNCRCSEANEDEAEFTGAFEGCTPGTVTVTAITP